MLKHRKPLAWPVELHDKTEYVPPERQRSIVVKHDQFGNCLRPVAWWVTWHCSVLRGACDWRQKITRGSQPQVSTRRGPKPHWLPECWTQALRSGKVAYSPVQSSPPS